ncbi:BTB/POZ domain-containing protein [Quillaja saponaria]|uniref:BTB/POZ domain-containing protein n=1 Tax=Quillaja saponaria TaxID=32244 RepID=A0AAD7Q562_QUISA|nr:BTB/POZ domain-containing protein [Quillaja saponaria]
MASMKLGSKSEVFYLDGHAWLCSTGLPSDVIIEIKDMSFHLHKFPLMSRSGVLENLIERLSGEDEKCVLQLHDIPGGAKSFLLIARFCYGVKIELTALNVVSLRCAAEYLSMTEEYGEGNLIKQTENFLNAIFGYWTDSIRALETCEEVLPLAEKLHIVSRCINSLAMKASADPSLFSWPMSGQSALQSPEGTVLWNGICITTETHTVCEDWWYEDVSFLRLPLYKRLILGVSARCMKPERIAGSLYYYAKRHIPLLGSQPSIQNGSCAAPRPTVFTPSDVDQRNLLEEIVELLSNEKGAQLDQAALEDLLILNMGYSVETLYDIDCVQRMLDHFMLLDHDVIDSPSDCMADEGQLIGGSQVIDPNDKDYARPLDDGIYRAIDIYLKAHPWLTDSEREQLCRLMNCQKLSLEASTHAAQNERLPLRVIVQVLFFEQLRLRTSVAGWFFVSDNLENSQNQSGNLALARNDMTTHNHVVAIDDMKQRVSELEKECLSMKQELEKIVKTKGISWNMFFKKLSFRLKSKSCDTKASKPSSKSKVSPASTAPLENGRANHETDEMED